MIEWIGITHLALHTLMANTLLGQWCWIDIWLGNAVSVQVQLTHAKSFLAAGPIIIKQIACWSKRNPLLPKKRLLFPSHSWTERMLQYCWLTTLISRSACLTPNPFISNQWYRLSSIRVKMCSHLRQRLRVEWVLTRIFYRVILKYE